MGGFCLGGFVQEDFVQGDFVQGDFVQGDFVWGVLSGGFCPRTMSSTLVISDSEGNSSAALLSITA